MKYSTLTKSIVVTVFVLAAVAIMVYQLRGRYVGIREGKADANYIKSTDCRACHEDHYSSWRATHHSRMTQEAKAETIQGDFERDNTFEYLGVRATMSRRGNDHYIDLAFPDGRTESNKVERTVGSRRVEQYVTRRNGQYYRLPVAYDLVNRRWMSLNGSFFFPDGDNFNQHLAQWDTNCVFCHNVKAQPNFNFQTRLANTEVAELGIACGSCHGQGAEHAEQASSPLTRAIWRIMGAGDTKIVDPLELDSDRAMMVCGHCHGQRIPEPTDRIREVMGKGDPYDAGEDLSKLYKPIHADTKLGEVSFANRFWPDGSPRLTAYEYQGITASACFLKGQKGNRVNCMSCHTMHDGDIKGQITSEKRTNTACTQCHTALSDTVAMTSHTGHGPESKGSSCYSCHMPEVVYGVQTMHKTHQITIPDPGLTINKAVPNACSQCHVDKSANWAVDQARAIWPERFANTARLADPQFDIAEGVRGLYAGDALTRAMMADALVKHSDAAWSEAFLVEAFAGDNYPIVRYFAANGLAAIRTGRPKPDYLGSSVSRTSQTNDWWAFIDALKAAEAKQFALDLRSRRKDVDIEVGE